ncbi:crossover junction endodeoxyribonuclease RuvC [Candidatus Falkowbacteria bacterium]|nr:MAG: crossover junction endodeoxyribonuclease RuvC [Candidatus Falkowbacteria bacterium]
MSYKRFSVKDANIILGIDPGIADTGYGVIKKDKQGKLTCLDYGSIKTKAKLSLPDRLEIISQEINKLIKKYNPRLAGVEQIFFCKNVKTALVVGHARGVVLLTIKQNNLEAIEFTPLQIKQAVSTYGRASKMQVQKMVKLLLNLKEIPKPDDAADALAAAICTANSGK